MKHKRFFSSIVALVLILGLMPASFPVSAANLTVSPASTQQRRMWGSQNYNSTDWVYEPWVLTSWARVQYVRFAINDFYAPKIKKATIKVDARAKADEKEVYLAAINISDDSALKVESNLTSLKSTNKVTATGNADKLMINGSGYYLPAVASSVVAYTKATASDATTTEDIYTNSSGTTVYNHPVTFELDVTESVREALSKGNHVQFVLSTTKDVLTPDNENLYETENFGHFANGVIYDENGNVIRKTANKLSLDTSIPVCGSAAYYTGTVTNDEYFSWVHMLRNSIVLEIEYETNEEFFNDFVSGITKPQDLGENLDAISHLLDAQTFEIYKKINGNGNLNKELFDLIKSSSLESFKESFVSTVNKYYSMETEYILSIKTDLGGRRGVINVISDEEIPYSSYALIQSYDDADNLINDYTVSVKNGLGYYNIYTKEDSAKRVDITLTSDQNGENPISATRSVYTEKLNLPEIFITELTNKHVKTHYPDEGQTQNNGAYKQTFQFVELYNYSDKAVDLRDYEFIYTTSKDHHFEWIWEDGADTILSPGELFVIGVYSGDTVESGYKYDSDSEIKRYWEGFNKFYNTTVPEGSRVMIACTESGSTTAIDEIDRLVRSADIGVDVSARIEKDGETVTKVDLSDDGLGSSSYSYQFTPSWGDSETENFLFSSGNFPYALHSEQNLDFCEKVYFSESDPIKVMSYNILATDDPGRTVRERYPLLIRTIKDFDLDIIGLQEVNYIWIPFLKGDDLSEYACVEGYSSGGTGYDDISTFLWELMNPIYYKKNKYTLLEEGKAFLTPDGKSYTQQWDSVNMKRTMTWAVLKDNATGEVTSVVNTHLVLSGKKARVEQVRLLHQKGAELKNKYGGGIVIMGDHNMHENSEPYHEYMNSNVVLDSKYLTTNHDSSSTTKTFGQYSSTYGSPIDFCMVSPEDYIVEKYRVFDGIYPEGIVSDHSAVYIELLTKGDVADSDTDIISYDNENCSAQVRFNDTKSATVIFADYEDNKLNNIDIVKCDSNGLCYDEVAQKNKDFSLDKGDKIFVFDTTFEGGPKCEEFIID